MGPAWIGRVGNEKMGLLVQNPCSAHQDCYTLGVNELDMDVDLSKSTVYVADVSAHLNESFQILRGATHPTVHP